MIINEQETEVEDIRIVLTRNSAFTTYLKLHTIRNYLRTMTTSEHPVLGPIIINKYKTYVPC